jgi:hypothetical protein
MKKNEYEILVERITDRVMKRLMEKLEVSEGNGFENIFDDLKKELENIEILPNNIIDASKYEEKAIMEAMKNLGYEYKKAIGNKLHFFNKQNSISLYLLQGKKTISLVP